MVTVNSPVIPDSELVWLLLYSIAKSKNRIDQMAMPKILSMTGGVKITVTVTVIETPGES
jgi:hypothetical protein